MRIVLITGTVLLFGIAICVRLWALGASAFGADNMEFYRLALQNQNILDFWKDPPWLNQIPLNETFSLLLVKIGLPATPFVVRLPFAFMGILAVLFIWLFARRHAGAFAATVILILAVVNPYQIYFSRTAYHYSGAITWSAALFGIFWLVKEHLQNNQLPPRRLVIAWFAVALLACHMHMSVWALCALQGILLLGYGWLGLKQESAQFKRFGIWLCVGGSLSILIMSRWIFRALQRLELATAGQRDLVGEDATGEFVRLLPAFFAGETAVGTGLLFAAVALAVVAFIKTSPQRAFFRSLTLVFLLHLLVYIVYVAIIGGGIAKIAYFSAIWPLFILFMGTGIVYGIEALCGDRPRLRYGLTVSLLGGYLAITLPATWAVINLEGKPTPYFRINNWVSENLPAGTPVLADRWLEPWNELAIHNAEEIHYTFTVPDEPLETYHQMQWRNTAEAFLRRYPQAALLRFNPDKYERELGVWDFPSDHFQRSAILTNEAALRMHQLGFAPTGEYYNEHRMAVRVLYNTPEDIIDAARQNNETALRLFGEGWDFLKPWQPLPGWPEELLQLVWIQAGAFEQRGRGFNNLDEINRVAQPEVMQYLNQGRWADYRVPSPHSTLRLFNLTDSPQRKELRLVGVALTGPIQARVGETRVPFPATLMVEQRVVLSLQPGEQDVRFSVPADQMLLLLNAELVPLS